MIVTILDLLEFLTAILSGLLGAYVWIEKRIYPFGLFLLAMCVQSLSCAFADLFDMKVLYYSFVLVFAYGPLLYFTIKTLLFKYYVWNYKQVVHCLLPMIMIGALAAGFIDWYIVIAAAGTQVLAYLILCYRAIARYQTVAQHTRSVAEPSTVVWLRKTLDIIVLISLAHTSRVFLGINTEADTILAIAIHSTATLFLITLVVRGMRDSDKVFPIRAVEEKLADDIISDTDTDYGNEQARKDIAELTATIKRVMEEEKPHLNPELSINEFAKSTGCTSRELSWFIKLTFRCSFPEYINRARVEEAKGLMHNPYYEQTALVDIGLQAGFNSRSSFFTMFKRFTGVTPSQYRKGLAQTQADYA